MANDMREEVQKDLCLYLVAEMVKDEWGQTEIGDYKCTYYNCKKPPCHRACGDLGFIDMYDCKHRTLDEKVKENDI